MKRKIRNACISCIRRRFSASTEEKGQSENVDRLPAVESTGSSVLVAYFSTDDTVRAAAYTAADALSADLFEIQPAEPYTADDLNYRNRQSRTSILGHIDIGQEELKAILGSGDAADTLSVTP